MVTANVRGRDIASVVAEAQAGVEREVRLPAGYSITWGGQFENLAAAEKRLMVVVPGCFFLIFLLLYTALGSPRDALLVFSAVPLALTGGIATLWLRGMPLSVSAAVGFIALSGVAVLNGLVMLNHIKQLRGEGLGREEAVRQGAHGPAAAGGDDGAGRLARLRADGDRHRGGRGGAEADRHRGHRRPGHRDAADADGAARPLREVRQRRSGVAGERGAGFVPEPAPLGGSRRVRAPEPVAAK